MDLVPRRIGRIPFAACALILFPASIAFGFFGFRVFGIAFELGLLAVSIPRLHDIGRSGWWSLLFILPFVAIATMLGLMVWPGKEGENAFGPAPRW